MYIVALAWIYVVLMVSIMQPTVLKGVVTFVGTGLLPLALFLYLMGTPQRRRNLRRAEEANTAAGADAPVEPTRDAPDDARRDAPDDADQSDSRQTSVAQRPVTRSRRNE